MMLRRYEILKSFIKIVTFIFSLGLEASYASEYFGPVHGCTFYDTSENTFWGCAEPKIKKDCTITRCAGPVCTSYRGERGYMHRPVFLIEVTTKYGESMFADAYPLTLGNHLKAAKSWYKRRSKGFTSKFADSSSIDLAGESIFWHARVLPVPFGSAAFSYSDLPLMTKASAAAPSCYYGVSEFVIDQWNLGLSDRPFASSWAPLSMKQCVSTASAIASAEINSIVSDASKVAGNALSNIASIAGGESFGLGCAYGVSPSLLLAQNLMPTSDALNYQKLCMGQLGGLLPRQGLINNSNPFRSAVMAAWKFASLTKDAFFDSVGGIESSDKWQLVYPKAVQDGCVKPSSVVSDWHMPGPFEMRKPLKEDGQSYVFAIWRKSKTNTCYEPGTGNLLWKDLVKGPNFSVIKGACKL